jgi:hypothetical protein
MRYLRLFDLDRNVKASFALGCSALAFFVSSKVFLTCAHVLIDPANPHIDGDRYDFVSNTGLTQTAWTIQNTVLGTNAHIFHDCDLALLSVDGNQSRSYLPLEYADIPVGTEIGVAGYPAPILQATPEGAIDCSGLIYRVARNVLTATYMANINMTNGAVLTNIPAIEVNFLFVPGNSGGPIFTASNGRVIGFVQGFRSYKIEEKLETTAPTLVLPAGMSNSYVLSNSAVYSFGVGLQRIRVHLEALGRYALRTWCQ